jgi:hypothetical protein
MRMRNANLLKPGLLRPVKMGLLLVLAITGGLVNAQQTRMVEIPEDTGNLVHFSYATLLGTGVYRLDDRTVTVFRLPLGWSIREPVPEKFGIEFKLPVAVGFYDFDVLENLIPVGDQLSTISVAPGVALQFLLGERWRLEPAVYTGLGYDMANNEAAWIYGGGISALYEIPLEYPRMNFGTAVLMSGYVPDDGESDFITRWSFGVDSSFLTPLEVWDRRVFLGGHVIGYYYLDQVQFQTIGEGPIEINAELELGLFFGTEPAPEIFGIEINRLGAGYRFSEEGDAIVFFAGFPF